MSNDSINWQVFKGDHQPDATRIQQLPPPPPWRQFRKPIDPNKKLTKVQEAYQKQISDYWQELLAKAEADEHSRDRLRGENFRIRMRGENFRIRTDQARVIQAVNAALALRRPLLITGRPGSGKTSLAYAIAYELQLGPVLMWPITARSTLEAGLYRYDVIARLQDAQLRKPPANPSKPLANPTAESAEEPETDPYHNIGDYIQLGPLGTAFLPTPYPRVLVIDEIDKSDINLPNDLLNLLEEGQFEIPELVRLSQRQSRSQQPQVVPDGKPLSPELEPIEVITEDDLKLPIEGGKIRCDAFPLIVMTSNGERDFPPAFLRRCLRIEMPKPEKDDLYNIVEAHLTKDVADQVGDLIRRFFSKTDTVAAKLATDQLLNAVYLRKHGADKILADGDPETDLEKLLFSELTSTGSDG
jgi:MoxR-like ATPase